SERLDRLVERPCVLAPAADRDLIERPQRPSGDPVFEYLRGDEEPDRAAALRSDQGEEHAVDHAPMIRREDRTAGRGEVVRSADLQLEGQAEGRSEDREPDTPPRRELLPA